MKAVQKEIVLLPFPFSDLQSTKARPALIVSNDEFNNKSADCIMVPLTTNIKYDKCSIIINSSDLSYGKIIEKSRIKADKLFCLEKKLIKMKVAKLNDEIFQKVKNKIITMF
ncbi:MAG: type II toxin-antitoxin system PemK/MazF family toxin [Candidatus Woesearchaeota archaeon]